MILDKGTAISLFCSIITILFLSKLLIKKKKEHENQELLKHPSESIDSIRDLAEYTENIKFQVIFFIILISKSIADLGESVAILLSLSVPLLMEDPLACSIQASLIQYFMLANGLYSGLTGFALYYAELKPRFIGRYNVPKLFTILIILIALLALILTIILLIFFPNTIGPRIYWCWIKIENGENVFYEISFLYAYLFVVYILNIILFALISIKNMSPVIENVNVVVVLFGI